jgi:ATP-dependent DNA helicase RecG
MLHPFEAMIAKPNQTADEVLSLLNYPDYFQLLKLLLPDNKKGILTRLEDEHFLLPNGTGNWDITNFEAILFSRKLDDFNNIGRKAVRVILYIGKAHIETQKEQIGGKGYASI